MFSSASTSKVFIPASRSRQQSVQSQVSEMGGDEDAGIGINNNTPGSTTRRKANRSNPQVSYAYGAPSDGKRIAKKPRSSKESTAELKASASPPPAESKAERLDAAARYKAIKEKQQKRHTTPSNQAGGTNNVESPRRSTRLSRTGSQDGAPIEERRRAIASIEEDQPVEEEEEEERASSSASQQRRKRLLSPGQSRNGNPHLSSFYLDVNRSNEDDNANEVGSGLPTSLLRGSQRPRHETNFSGAGMNSIRSSDLGDSRSHDYAEEERYASMMEQNGEGISATHEADSMWSPRAWFKSKVFPNGKEGDENGDTSMEKRKRKGRISDDNRLYRPEQEIESESDSGTSQEGRKHSHRKKKNEVAGGARGGRDDKKIWMNSGRRKNAKRRSMDGEDNFEAVQEEAETQKQLGIVSEEKELATDSIATEKKAPRKSRSSIKQPGQEFSIPLWAMILGALLLLGSLGLNVRVKQKDNLNYGSISSVMSSLSAPKTLTEASQRILKLEAAFEALKMAGDNAAKEETRLATRLSRLENENGKLSQSYTVSHSAMQSEMKNAEAESKRIRSEMSKLQSRLESMQVGSRADEAAVSTALKNRLDTLESQIKSNDKHIQDVSERSKSAERVAAETKQSLNWLEKTLPAEVAVPIQQSSGKPSLDAATWQELRKLFIARDDTDFQRRNEQTMRALSAEIVEDKVKTGVIVDRETFLSLLESELSNVKAAMEARFNANAGEMQNDILAKVRAQQDMFEKSGSWKKAQRASSQDISQINIPAKEAIMELIEAALEVYSADRIGRRDFALYSAGGRVIPSLTSPTFKLQTRSFFSWGNHKQETAKPPVIALHHDTSPGMCWAFDGDDGQLGIGLARKVLVSDVTLEHVSASISLEAGSSAPRDVTVWGLVERQDDRKRLAAHRLAQQQHNNINDVIDETPSPAPPSNNHILLASFTYDVDSTRAIQTFPVSNEARQVQIPVSVVQVRVTSNHGNKDFTCLYRIRIHGQEWTEAD